MTAASAIDIEKATTVTWDDPLGEVETRGRFKGKIKRRSKLFRGKGSKGRAKAFFNTLKNYNPTIKEYDYLVF